MVNASLNWASIVGIALAVCGAGLYFLRSFKPALARDYDVFFAAIGLLCGGILFFQGWRLDPILQFGQFLLAGTTVFFAYESVRLRGIATDQARRSSYFDDDPELPRPSRGGLGGSWSDESYDRFEESQPINRRFARNDYEEEYSNNEDFSTMRPSRAAIPEEAISRRPRNIKGSEVNDRGEERNRRMARFTRNEDSPLENSSSFGERRTSREEIRRGTRPSSRDQTPSRKRAGSRNSSQFSSRTDRNNYGGSSESKRATMPRNDQKLEDAAFSNSDQGGEKPKNRSTRKSDSRNSSQRPSAKSRYSSTSSQRPRPRDNSSRFDD